MIRKAMKMLLVALVAACALGSMAEAAPKKAVRHRAKHSTRVSSGTTESDIPKADKKATPKRRATSPSPAAARHKPTTTKPR
jgi:hypothetical protein